MPPTKCYLHFCDESSNELFDAGHLYGLHTTKETRVRHPVSYIILLSTSCIYVHSYFLYVKITISLTWHLKYAVHSFLNCAYEGILILFCRIRMSVITLCLDPNRKGLLGFCNMSNVSKKVHFHTRRCVRMWCKYSVGGRHSCCYRACH